MKRKKITRNALITVLVALSIVTVGIFAASLNTEFDASLIKKGYSTTTQIFYYDFEDRENRVGSALELKEEEIFANRSEWVSIYSMPKELIDAFVSVEDKRFYTHSGVDWFRTGKAALNYIFGSGKDGFGGSTITQQLIKNVTGENQVTVKRKVEEIIKAIRLEKALSKNEILEGYLNVVYLSENCYGVSAAADIFFNKDVNSLTLSECASLASIVKDPSKYDPYKNPQNNKNRRKIVLDVMLEQGKIGQNEYNEALNEEIEISTNINNVTSGTYSWYTETLIEDVSTDLAEKYNITKENARALVLKGGYKIYSLIDVELQKTLEDVYEKYSSHALPEIYGKTPESSAVIMDPKTSDVLAIVGGIGKKEGNLIFNRAISAKRPYGSVIKPLSVYAPLIYENKITYSTVFDDTPIENSNGVYWPKNSPDRYRGLMPVSYALEHSVNTVAVKALKKLGYGSSMDYLSRLGIGYDREKDNNASSLALGQLTNGETVYNLCAAYCALANGGEYAKPRTYLYVTDNKDNLILSTKRESNRVFDRESAYITTKMLENVVNNGTAKEITVKDRVDVAGKTGTTSDNKDKWFVGYTPDYVMSVWSGYDVPMPLQSPKNPSTKIFDTVMSIIYSGRDEFVEFESCPGVIEREFCFDSGKIPDSDCLIDERGDRTLRGYYKLTNQPIDTCDIHKSVTVNKDNGLMVKGFLPFWKKRRISLLDYVREKQEGISVLDTPYLISSRE